MILLSAIVTAFLTALALYLLMRRSVLEILLGVVLLGNASFLALVTVSGWKAELRPPVLVTSAPATEQHLAPPTDNAETDLLAEEPTKPPYLPPSEYVDPLPQALILTAIVISFGVTAFLIILIARGFEETGSIGVGEMPDLAEEIYPVNPSGEIARP